MADLGTTSNPLPSSEAGWGQFIGASNIPMFGAWSWFAPDGCPPGTSTAPTAPTTGQIWPRSTEGGG